MDKNTVCCHNCKYFLQHYVKRDMNFVWVASGQCLRSKISKIKRAFFDRCEFWRAKEDELPQQCDKIENLIKKVYKQLDDILIFLNNDEKRD